MVQKRDDIWLLSRMDHIWSNFFLDVPQTNKVFIKFGRYSKLRLGSIKMDRRTKSSYITITSMFKSESIPAEVVEHTIAHELIHYTHGFSSPNPRMHKHPHHGGVIRKEMQSRGLNYLFKAFSDWKKKYRDILKDLSKRKYY